MFNRLSITTRFVAIILCLSIFLILLYSSLGFVTARDSLRNSIDEHLVSIREAKAHELKSLMKRIRTQVLNLAISTIGQEAARDFITGFADTQDRQLSANEDQLLSNFYNKEFLPALAKSLDAAPNPSTYIPQDAQIKYLQYHYIANNPLHYEKKGGLVQAPEDKSGYAAAHQRWHPQLERFARTNEYEDLLVVDAASDQVVYSVNKTVEFATNLRDGPYAESNLGRLYKLVRRSADRDDYQMIDFDRYRPIMNRPAAFIASPVFQADHMIAVLIFRFPVEIATNILTGDRNWKSQGLGSTGETLLIADDHTLRSRSRFMLEDKDAFMNVLKQLGTPTRILDRIEKDGMLIFNLHDRSEAVTQAMLGETGIMACTDYRNQSVLAAYAPIEVENRRWAIVSKMDQDEAFAPIYDFGRQALALAAGSIIVLTLVAMMVARYFLRPIQQLSAAARQVSRGNYDVEVQASSGYEFRDLADAFNEMTRSLMQKNQQIARKMEENEKLLLNILPAPVAARLKEGGELTDSFSDVTVLFAEIRGFDDLAEVIPAGQAVKLLNELIVSFDEASERHGVEKVKTVGTSFMAVCGLSVQRPDHVNRIVEFALELKRIITAFNQLRNTNLHLVIGIHAGPVVGGVVGKDKFIYELWGNTVNVAQALRSSERLDTIQVTDAVRERLGDLHRFIQLGEIELPNRTHIAVWLIES